MHPTLGCPEHVCEQKGFSGSFHSPHWNILMQLGPLPCHSCLEILLSLVGLRLYARDACDCIFVHPGTTATAPYRLIFIFNFLYLAPITLQIYGQNKASSNQLTYHLLPQ